MKFQLFKGAGYKAVIFDETQMVPDPRFLRAYPWPLIPPLEIKVGESIEDFAARQQAATAAYEASIEREATLLYESEFDQTEPVKVVEKELEL